MKLPEILFWIFLLTWGMFIYIYGVDISVPFLTETPYYGNTSLGDILDQLIELRHKN
jgi:hypothetical protein